MTVTVTFELDGESVTVETRPDQPLRELLRESLDAKQVKSGCESGRCGVCTVLLDDTVVKSCLTPAPKVDGRRVRTIADIGTDEDLHPVQTKFVDNFAAQCGYCTPGSYCDGRFPREHRRVRSRRRKEGDQGQRLSVYRIREDPRRDRDTRRGN
ncbi:(2Fe-2S)-binding protein [Natrialba swarupiae]|nr:(2Fe-2S)-binding protein [Natrialba swarupiae]